MNRNIFAIKNIIDKLKKSLTNFETFKFYINTYILSKFENTSPDIYIVSYPKCGRTWLRIMLIKYFEKLGYEILRHKDNSILHIKDMIVIKFEHDKGNWVPAPFHPKHIKFNKKKYGNKRVIFLIRDPRDVLISSWYHLKYRENIYKQGLTDFIIDELIGIQKIVHFFNIWYKNQQNTKDFLLLSYENLHNRTEDSFQKMLEFIGHSTDSQLLNKAIEDTKFNKMQRMESSGDLKEPWMKPGSNKSQKSLKIRKGKIGSYKDELSNDDIAYINTYMKTNLHPELYKLYKND